MTDYQVTRLTACIDASILSAFPTIKCAGFIATGIKHLDPSGARLVAARQWELALARTSRGHVTPDTASSAIEVSQWREIFAQCGVRPSDVRSSVEVLLRRGMNRGPMRHHLPLVELYCAISARWRAPIGAYDVASLSRNEMVLRFAQDSDSFRPIGAHQWKQSLRRTIPVYACANDVCCYMFNARDSTLSAISEDTCRCVVFGEAITEQQQAALHGAFDDLRHVLSSLGAVVGELVVLSKSTPSAELVSSREDLRTPRGPRLR